MPVDGSGASGGGKGRRGGKKPPPLLVLPPAAVPTTTTTTSSSSSAGGRPSTSGPSRTSGATSKGAGTAGSSSSSASSSSSSYDYAAAQRQRDKAARDRYVVDAEQMQGQIKALQMALGPKGEFRDALKKRLGNIERILGQQMDDLDKAEAARSGSLDADQRNNESAASDSTGLNNLNRARERTSAVAEAFMQGSGESDALRTQLMSLRSGDANQGEINRAYHDGQRSINNSRIDLALDTHNARVNMVTEANADKEQLHTTFNNQVSETWTQLGNALGQQAEYLGLARESARNAGIKGGRGLTSSSSSSSSSGGKGKKGDRGGDRDSGAGLGQWSSGQPTRPGKAGPPRDGGLSVMSARRPTADSLNDPRGGDDMVDSGLDDLGSGGGKGGRKRLGKGLKGDEARASRRSDRAFKAAAQAQGRAWRNPGLPQELRDWEAPVPEEKQLASSMLTNARTATAMSRPEGATLRKW